MNETTHHAAYYGNACICLGLRQGARAISRLYDQAFDGLGITSGQFSILAALFRERPVSVGALSDDLGLDRTTLNRNLRPLLLDKLIDVTADPEDKRVHAIRLTAKGKALLEQAIPLWQDAQKKMMKKFGQSSWPEFRQTLTELISAANDSRENIKPES